MVVALLAQTQLSISKVAVTLITLPGTDVLMTVAVSPGVSTIPSEADHFGLLMPSGSLGICSAITGFNELIARPIGSR